MLANYFLIGIRNVMRHRLFSLINIVGLALGLTAFLLISEFVRFERSYDRQFEQSENLYRLSTIEMVNDVVDTKDAMMTRPAAGRILADVPGVINATTSLKLDEMAFRNKQQPVFETGVISADSNFLDIFTYPVLHGDRNTMLDEPFSIVLTESKALAYFGRTDVVGETIAELGEYNRRFKVTGVLPDIPQNTHYKFDFLISDKTLVDRFDYNEWGSFNFYTYLILEDGIDLDNFHATLDEIIFDIFSEEETLRWRAMPIADIHLTSDFTYEPEAPGSASATNLMLIIALLILAIAWVNYINLSTARALDRAREVGLRKVIGAQKSQLIFQFLMEAFIVNLAAGIIAIGLGELLLPWYHQLVGTEIMEHIWTNPDFLRNLVLFFVVGTLVSGFYPALVLSSFEPVKVLKGRYRNTKSGALLRKALVVAQFSASIVLVAGTFTVYQQLNYMLTRDLGVSTDSVVAFRMPAQSDDDRDEQKVRWNAFKDELRAHASIESVGGTSNLPGGGGSDINSTTGANRIVGKTDYKQGTIYIQYMDDQFMDAVDIELLAGRNFDRTREYDTAVVIMNESFLQRHGIYDPQSVVGEYLQFEWGETRHEIIGVIKDFNRTTLKLSVEPTLYMPWMDPNATVVELVPAGYKAGIAHVEDRWAAFFPNTPFELIFLDQRFEALYEQDQRFGRVSIIFALLAMFIAGLGLFGLSAFMAVQRTKEVGVRKVLGASISQIVMMFYKDFAKLIAVAAIIGIPLVYYVMTSWLQNYAFRIDFPWPAAIFSLIIVSIFALLVVGSQVYRVAVLNPADTLQYE